ncbi:hypothetical protein [Desulfosarcina sp.]|uniref:hypothetical protein n=1 Tax=Desulfosarcina sp. TaxID=2027861 RepID=UPI0029B772CC|nr:hypothetical protein [Desulfosarcina sp.]MDX2455204.1 hypothetical protein [Desulfosarcina sp.]
MFKRLILVALVFIVGFSTAYAEDNFKIEISPELQGRLDVIESRVQPPASNFGYRTVRLTVKPKQPGDRPVVWAKFYDADGTLLETIWDRVKSDSQQKCKFDYMDVQNNATRIELSVGNQE